jgi:hypothetical protein
LRFDAPAHGSALPRLAFLNAHQLVQALAQNLDQHALADA